MTRFGKLLRGPSIINTLAKEPPFRLVTKALLKRLPASIQTKAEWDAVRYPQYLVGVIEAARQAGKEGTKQISAIEFGVASGKGLLSLQGFAAAVEEEMGVSILVYGFDTGQGLPEPGSDYRNHPDIWKQGDFPMDFSQLRALLMDRTTLVLGDVAETVHDFVRRIQQAPVGFVAVDVDYYTSTLDVLRIFTLPGKRMLRVVPMYFDDVYQMTYHRFAGELLAIDEFNRASELVKIDRWRDIDNDRAFPEAAWLKGMYLAHDLEAISKVFLSRQTVEL